MEDFLTLRVKAKDVNIVNKNDMVEINILNDMDIVLNTNNNFLLNTKGQFHILADDEISFASKKGVHIDSINSSLYLNSRRSSILKDEPESVSYRARMELDFNKTKLETIKQENFTLKLKDRVSILEDKIKEIEKCHAQE